MKNKIQARFSKITNAKTYFCDDLTVNYKTKRTTMKGKIFINGVRWPYDLYTYPNVPVSVRST